MNFLTSWKTTIAGLAAGGLNMFANGTNWKQVLVTVGMAALGILAKDGDVSHAPVPLVTAASTTEQK